MESDRNPLADGIYFERPKEGRPEFVKGHISIKADKAIAMINKYKNDRDYVNLDLLQSKDKTKLYLVVDNYRPAAAPTDTQPASDELPPF